MHTVKELLFFKLLENEKKENQNYINYHIERLVAGKFILSRN